MKGSQRWYSSKLPGWELSRPLPTSRHVLSKHYMLTIPEKWPHRSFLFQKCHGHLTALVGSSNGVEKSTGKSLIDAQCISPTRKLRSGAVEHYSGHKSLRASTLRLNGDNLDIVWSLLSANPTRTHFIRNANATMRQLVSECRLLQAKLEVRYSNEIRVCSSRGLRLKCYYAYSTLKRD